MAQTVSAVVLEPAPKKVVAMTADPPLPDGLREADEELVLETLHRE